ncbi:unnamed protein product [Effrenium voratum]|nr:unnamed protein product [Effrenium voratum]
MWFSKGAGPEWLRGLCVLRVLKAERYVGAFAMMASILGENGAILKATALVSFLLWLLVSSLLHFTERFNPDEEVKDEVYASVPRALWAEVINLHGEWPWCDYTWRGKAIGTFLNFVSIGICMVPVVVFSDAFMSRVGQEAEVKAQAPAALPAPAPKALEGAAPSPEVEAAPAAPAAPEAAPAAPDPVPEAVKEEASTGAVEENAGFGLLYSHLLPPKVLEKNPITSVIFILLSAFNTVFDSMPSLSVKDFGPAMSDVTTFTTMPGEWREDLMHAKGGFIPALLVGLVLTAMLAGYMCIRVHHWRSEFEETRAARLQWQALPGRRRIAASCRMELVGLEDGESGPPRSRYHLDMAADGTLTGHAWRPTPTGIVEVAVAGRLQMTSADLGEVRWHEVEEGQEIEVQGWLAVQGSSVQIIASFLKPSDDVGLFRLTGNRTETKDEVPAEGAGDGAIEAV